MLYQTLYLLSIIHNFLWTEIVDLGTRGIAQNKAFERSLIGFCLDLVLMNLDLYRYLGSISPNCFAKQKVASAWSLVKNLQFNFTSKVVRLKLGQNLPNMYEICWTPIANKGVELCTQVIQAHMLMKLTPEVTNIIDWGSQNV